MLKIPIILLVMTALAAAGPKGGKKEWAVAGAPYRVELHVASPPDDPDAGWEIRLPDFGYGRPDMRDAVLIGPDGKEIALDGVWRGTGRTLLMLAASMPDEGEVAMLYFGGNNSPRMKSWSAKRSLLLETKRLPAGADVATFGGWQEAWKKSKAVDGMGFVPLIFQGENPFGESGHFMSRYTGRLKTGDGGNVKFYTLSHDVSYVMIEGHPVLKWQQTTPPPLDPTKVPMREVKMPANSASVEYCHATGDPPAAMVLGWDHGGKLDNVAPDAWVHPGQVKADAIESHDGAPVPLAVLQADRYLGYGDEWYVSIKCAVANPVEGWQAEWLWPDGRVAQGPEIRRLWMSLSPLKMVLRLRNGIQVIEGRQVLVIPREIAAASVNNDEQRKEFLDLLDKEDPSALDEPALRAGFVLADDFLSASVAARWAEAWLKVAKPAPGSWVKAVTTVIRENAKRDPKAALDRLLKLDETARKVMAREAHLLELDLRVFGLKDPAVIGLAGTLRKGGDARLKNMAIIRLGDYYLLTGRIEDAVRCFDEAVADSKGTAQKAPVIDRAHSLAIEELVNGNHAEEAYAKLEEWEILHPAARIEGDQLLWRARVNFLTGDWGRALQDLETSLKVRPGSPEEIEVRFWLGRAQFELGHKDEARVIWNALVKDYPKHERAEAAKAWAQKP